MRIGIVESAYVRYGISEGARKAREHGFECYDFGRFIDTETEFFKLPEEQFKSELTHIRELVEAEGITVWQTHAPWRFPPRDATPEDRAERLDAMRKAIRGTSYIGAKNFVIHALMPFGYNSPENPELMCNINAEFMAELAKEAKAYGVEHINVENLPFPGLPLNYTEQCLAFVKRMNKETNSNIFKVCIDTGHSNACGESPAAAVRMVGKEYLGALHVHDNDGAKDTHWLPGEGTIDWKDFSDALAEIGFDGCMSFETEVPNDVPFGKERDKRETELAEMGKKIAKRA